jgi:hypothetical protein
MVSGMPLGGWTWQLHLTHVHLWYKLETIWRSTKQ